MASESFSGAGGGGLNLVHLRSCSYFEILYYHGVLRTTRPGANLEMVSARDVGERRPLSSTIAISAA
jgi:hypothetical protein